MTTFDHPYYSRLFSRLLLAPHTRPSIPFTPGTLYPSCARCNRRRHRVQRYPPCGWISRPAGRSPRSSSRHGTPGNTLSDACSRSGRPWGRRTRSWSWTTARPTGPGSRWRPMDGWRSSPTSENQGFARGCNQGAAKARDGVVVFLNSDTVVPTGWLDELLAPFEQATSAPSARARTTSRGGRRRWPSPIPRRTPMPSPSSPRRGGPATGVRRQRHGGLIGFCLAVRTSSFHALGGFDERFEIGGFEDDDLCRRLHQRRPSAAHRARARSSTITAMLRSTPMPSTGG